MAILFVEMVEQVHNYQRHQPRHQNVITPELHVSGEYLPTPSAEQRGTLWMGLFQVICDRPGARNGFSRINEDRDAPLTRQTDSTFADQSPRYCPNPQT